MKKVLITFKLNLLKWGKQFLAVLLFFIFSLTGCVASSCFYNSRTLEQNKFAFAFGADDIALKSSNTSSASIGISKDVPFAPSIGFAYGLPLRLETDLRWYPVRFLEAYCSASS